MLPETESDDCLICLCFHVCWIFLIMLISWTRRVSWCTGLVTYLNEFEQCGGRGDVEVNVNVRPFLSHIQGRPVLKHKSWNTGIRSPIPGPWSTGLGHLGYFFCLISDYNNGNTKEVFISLYHIFEICEVIGLSLSSYAKKIRYTYMIVTILNYNNDCNQLHDYNCNWLQSLILVASEWSFSSEYSI